ncbi:MAG: hypothetical protein ACXWKP_24015 [Bradyrhizobium sp.]
MEGFQRLNTFNARSKKMPFSLTERKRLFCLVRTGCLMQGEPAPAGRCDLAKLLSELKQLREQVQKAEADEES